MTLDAELTIWLGVVAVGLMLSVLGVLDASRDLEALRELPRNGRWLVARHQLLRYVLRVAMYGTSVLAMFALGAPELVAWLLIADRILLTATTLSDLLTGAFLRRGIREDLIEQREDQPT